jgi:dTDP-4-amino-4,6-dideoxygalactose transaminase
VEDLALLGGKPAVYRPLRPYRVIGEEERVAVDEVMKSGVLSGFFGSPGAQYLGGPKIREFEAAWAEAFDTEHAVAVNSNTSGLIAAMGAIGIGPGDEVILPPTTMSATAMAPIFYGGVPIFADIEPDTFCLDVDAVEAAITPRTKAIFAVNLFGQPANLEALRDIADKHGLHLVEDNAQAPFAMQNNRLTGTIGHIGVFSLNYHKHFHTGEGGVCTTDDRELADRLRMIRNHGENVTEGLEVEKLTNLVGFNFRMTELGAAIGIEQLKKAPSLVARRAAVADKLSQSLAGLEGITVPQLRAGCRHSYYVWAARYDERSVGVSRHLFSKALTAEGFPHAAGYIRPLYHLPLFRHRRAIGDKGFPFSGHPPSYGAGMCPVAERLHKEEWLLVEICAHEFDDEEIDMVAGAFRKVHRLRHRLAEAGPGIAGGVPAA